MTITSYDSIIAAVAAKKYQDRHFSKVLASNVAGQATSLWEQGTYPPAGSGGSSLIARNCDSSIVGALSFAPPVAPDLLYLTSGLAWATTGSIGSLVIYDRIADVSGIDLTSTGNKPITMSALPRYADGLGVQMFMEVTTTISGASPALTIDYTDQAGGASTSQTVQGVSGLSAGRFLYSGSTWVSLASGDNGVQKANNVNVSASCTNGIARLVFAVPLAVFPLLSAGTVLEKDFVTQIPRLPQIPDNACLGMFVIGAGSANGTISGTLTAVAG